MVWSCTIYSGSAFFHGPWFVHPIEVEHSPTRLFYKREVFRSSIEDTNPMLSIQGKCAVLVHKDYCNSRPTEIHEQDVFICESKYMEAEKSIRKLAKSMKVSSVPIQRQGKQCLLIVVVRVSIFLFKRYAHIYLQASTHVVVRYCGCIEILVITLPTSGSQGSDCHYYKCYNCCTTMYHP